jgi:enoyl-CoA hydratase/carnithine racemase
MSQHVSDASLDPEPNSVHLTKMPNGITKITIDRAHRRNAIDVPTAKKLTDAFLDFENDSTQKVCVFHGANDTFCAGFDLHELAKGKTGGSDGYEEPQPVQGRNRGPISPSRMQIIKPVICAVSGFAVAGGLELSLIADLRIVEESAVFGVFCRRFGVPLFDGGTVRLQAIVGLGRALDMILTGRGVGAQEALAMGLANRVVPDGKALEDVLKLAEILVSFPQECMLTDRASCYYAAYNAKSFEDALTREFNEGVKMITKESIQGAQRFSQGAGRHGNFGKL